MISPEAEALGLESAHRLARLGFVEIQPGLTDEEFAGVEERFAFQFADDHRAFLAAGLPVWARGHCDHPSRTSWSWPNWRDLDSEDLRKQVDWPMQSALDEIRGGHWPGGWSRRPDDEDRAMAKAQRRLASVPRMVPVYAHRYLPAGRGTFGHPVLSIHRLTDIIDYGVDIADYIVREFREPNVTVDFWRNYV